MKRLLSVVVAFLCSLSSFAQQGSISDDYDFILYLLGNDLSSDAGQLLRNHSYFPSDTLDYLKGWVAYSVKDLDRASSSFSNVSPSSSFYDKSAFFNAICNAHRGKYEEATHILEDWASIRGNPSVLLKDAYSLEMSGLSLLIGKKDDYLSWSKEFSGETAYLTENFDSLSAIYDDIFERPAKNKWTAALCSAILPGSGYYYAGAKEKGVLTFLLEGAFAAIIIDQANHYGFKDWHTLAWLGAGLTIHIIDICGAAISVSVKNEEYSQERNTAVLYNIHIPLRTIFK